MGKLFELLMTLGRLLLSMIFLVSAAGKVMDWGGTAAYMESKGMPLAPVFLAGAILFEVAGGLMVLLGFKARIGVVVLLVFLVPTTVIFHNFWSFEGQEQQTQMISFLKNLSIMGGLLMILGGGAGYFSIDNRKSAPPIAS